MNKTLLILIGIFCALIGSLVITYSDSVYIARIRLHSGNHKVIAKALFTITESHDKDSIPQIRKLLNDKDVFRRNAAINGLAKMGDKESIPEIRKFLNNKDSSVDAIYALSKLGDKEAIPDITEFLQDNDSLMRRFAIMALGNLDAKETIPKIMVLLKDKVDYVRQAAEDVLKQLGVPAEEIEKAKESK